MITKLLLSLIIYPGLLFFISFSLFSQWYRRKIIARLQGRVGPKYVGPFGILQPFADIVKLLSKEVTTHNQMALKTITLLELLGIFSLISTLLLTPLSTIELKTRYDVFIFLYMSLIATLAVILIGYGSSSVYPGIGGTRYLSLILLSEPIMAISIITLTEILSPNTFSLNEALGNPSQIIASLNISSAIALTAYISACISLALSLIAKVSFKPMDVSEAETEISGGLIAELSGPILSLYIILHEVELTLFLYIFSNLALPYPPINGLFNTLVSFVKYFVVLSVFTVIAFSLGRLRIEQAFKLLSKLALPLSIFSFILTFVT